MKRFLRLSLFAGVLFSAVYLTNAFFSDTETSQENSFQAGALDLKIDNLSFYNGQPNPDTSWEARDLAGDTYRFLNFTDIKPGDWGEDTISLHVETNDAWACYEVVRTANDDVSSTEPELTDGDTEDIDADLEDGELADFVQMAVWRDDGNGHYNGETILAQGTIASVLPVLKGALADSTGGIFGNTPLVGNQPYYLGKAWCFGTLNLNPAGISCDGSSLNNLTQTDMVTADITFSAIQARHNLDYTCTPNLVCTDGPLYVSLNISADQGKLKNDDYITNPARINPASVLGPPDNQFFSLGKNGEITLAFDGIIQDKEGPDLSVHEITNGRATYPEETAEILVSPDNLTYTSIGFATSEPSGIGGGDGITYLEIPDGLENIRYVKIKDVTNFALHANTADGYDLDAVDAVFGLCQ